MGSNYKGHMISKERCPLETPTGSPRNEIPMFSYQWGIRTMPNMAILTDGMNGRGHEVEIGAPWRAELSWISERSWLKLKPKSFSYSLTMTNSSLNFTILRANACKAQSLWLKLGEEWKDWVIIMISKKDHVLTKCM